MQTITSKLIKMAKSTQPFSVNHTAKIKGYRCVFARTVSYIFNHLLTGDVGAWIGCDIRPKCFKNSHNWFLKKAHKLEAYRVVNKAIHLE